MNLCEAVMVAQNGSVVKWTDFKTRKTYRAKCPPESTKLGLQWIDDKGNFDSSVEAMPAYVEGWTVEQEKL